MALCAAVIALGLAMIGAGLATSRAETADNPEVSARRKAERTTFTDAEIADGFFKIAFGAEMSTAGRVDAIRKFDGPIRVFVDNRARPDRRAMVHKTLADIRAHVAGLDIAETSDRDEANVLVTLIREDDFPKAVRRIFGAAHADRILKTLDPQCLSGFRKDGSYRITRADVLLVADVDDFTFLDCAYEELLQALGPINDDDSVPWTMFNDDVQMGFFDVYDQYLLNILYHPGVTAGMTREEVRRLLPQIMPTIRDFVSRTNGLPR